MPEEAKFDFPPFDDMDPAGEIQGLGADLTRHEGRPLFGGEPGFEEVPLPPGRCIPLAGKIPKTVVAQAGLTAAIGIFGLACLGDTFIRGTEKVIIGAFGDVTSSYPMTFTPGLFFASMRLFSQAPQHGR